MIRRVVYAVFVVALVAAAGGISTGCNNIIPPIAYTLSFGNAAIGPGSFTGQPGDPIVLQEGYSGALDLPSEAELEQILRNLAGDLVGEIVDIRTIAIEELIVEAGSGDFSFMEEVILYYRPKPVNGLEQDEIEIARGSSPDGFPNRFVIQPAEGLDFLELIRQNDANPAPGNPTYRIVVSGVVPGQVVNFETEIALIVRLSFGKLLAGGLI